MSSLREQIEHAINRASAENGSNTPDYILANYLTDCLDTFGKAVMRRSEFYGFRDAIGNGN